MQDKFINILKSDECIPEEMMMKYLRGSLSPAERHRIERHLIECDFCSDALEGLASQNILDTNHSLERLDARIEQRIKERKGNVITRQWIYRIAAVIVLVSLAGGGYYYMQFIKKSEKVFTENFEPFRDTTFAANTILSSPPVENEVLQQHAAPPKEIKNTEQKLPAKEKETTAEKGIIVTTATPEITQSDEHSAREEAGSKEIQIDNKEIYSMSEKKKSEAPKDETKNAEELQTNTQPAMQSMKKVTNSGNAIAAENEPRKKSQEYSDAATVASGNTNASAGNNLVAEGIRQYEEKNYPEAISIFNSALANDKSNSEVLFYNGVSYMSNNQNHEAIGSLETVIKNSPNKYADAAKWYLSLVYIKEHKISKAKSLLKELSENKNDYQDKARKTLTELN